MPATLGGDHVERRRRAARRASSSASGQDRELDRPLVGVVAREVRVARRPVVVEAVPRSPTVPRPCDARSTCRRRAGRSRSRPRPSSASARIARDVVGREVAQHLSGAHRRRVASARRIVRHGQEHAMEIDRYEPGVPSWVDLGSPDPQRRRRLLRRAVRLGAPRGTAGDGRLPRARWSATAPSPASAPQQNPGPPVWATLHRGRERRRRRREGHRGRRPGDRAADGRARRRAHGGVHRPGRRGLLASGRPATHPGAELVNEPGTWSWSELHHHRRRRVEGVLRRGVRLGRRHARRRPDGRVHGVAGRRPFGRRDDAEAADDAGRGAAALGASTSRWPTPTPRSRASPSSAARCMMPPMDIEPGRFAVVADPTGARLQRHRARARARRLTAGRVAEVAAMARPRGAKARADEVRARAARARVPGGRVRARARRTRSSCSPRRSSRRRRPTRTSTRSRPRCSPSTRRRPTSRTPIPTTSSAGVHRPASTARRPRTSSAWRACSTTTSTARCPPSSTTW